LPVVLYGCETWPLTLREECRLRMFRNRVLRRIFGPKRHEVTVERRKLHNEELNDMYTSPNIVKNDMGGACSIYEGEKKVFGILVGKPEGKSSLGRPSCRWRMILRWIFRK